MQLGARGRWQDRVGKQHKAGLNDNCLALRFEAREKTGGLDTETNVQRPCSPQLFIYSFRFLGSTSALGNE